jgi:hypothetical protein
MSATLQQQLVLGVETSPNTTNTRRRQDVNAGSVQAGAGTRWAQQRDQERVRLIEKCDRCARRRVKIGGSTIVKLFVSGMESHDPASLEIFHEI